MLSRLVLAASLVLVSAGLCAAQTSPTLKTTRLSEGQRKSWTYVVTFSDIKSDAVATVDVELASSVAVTADAPNQAAELSRPPGAIRWRITQKVAAPATTVSLTFTATTTDSLIVERQIVLIPAMRPGDLGPNFQLSADGPFLATQGNLSLCKVFLAEDDYRFEAASGKPDAEAAFACAEQLESHVTQLAKGETDVAEIFVGASIRDVDTKRRYLIRLHTLYRRVKQRNNTIRAEIDEITTEKQDASIKEARALTTKTREKISSDGGVSDTIHELMAGVGIRERLAASFDGGVSFAEAGNDTVPSGRDSTLETAGRGLIRWETEHFGDDRGSNWDFSLAGAFGFVPVMGLVSASENAAVIRNADTGLPKPFATYSQGLMWDVSPRWNVHVGDRQEFAVVARMGHTWTMSDIDVFERKVGTSPTNVTLTRLKNGVGRVTPFREIGVEIRLHTSESRDLLHHEKSYLNPAAYLGFGYRRDSRFKAGEELIGTDGDRLYFRLGLSINRIMRLPSDSKIASIQFGVDYDHSISRNVPSGLRLFIGPDINVIKLLRADTPAPPAAPASTPAK